MLKVGTVAPDFAAKLDDGSDFKLSAYRGDKHVVLYFYPKDFTPGCTAQACSFRDNYGEIAKYDAVIVGVSSDTEGSHTAFKEKYELPFPLIADPGKDVLSQYGASGFLMMKPRVTYVIDKQGTVQAAIRHDFRVTEHVPDVIEALKKLEPIAAE